jgi:hypothetical protein
MEAHDRSPELARRWFERARFNAQTDNQRLNAIIAHFT